LVSFLQPNVDGTAGPRKKVTMNRHKACVFAFFASCFWACAEGTNDSPPASAGGRAGISSTTSAGAGGSAGNADVTCADGVEQETRLEDDCEDGDSKTLLGGDWFVYDDHAGGGQSQLLWPPGGDFAMSAPGYGERGYAARMQGTTGTVLGWDYLALGFSLAPNSWCPSPMPPKVPLSHYDGIRFMAKGSAEGGPVWLIIHHQKDGPANNCKNGGSDTLTHWSDYQFDIAPLLTADWSEITVDFRRDLRQPSTTLGINQVDIETVLAHAKEVHWEFQTAAGGDVDLSVDNVELYKNCSKPAPELPTDFVSGDPAALNLRDDPNDPGQASSTLVNVDGQAFSQAVEATFTTDLPLVWDAFLWTPNVSAAKAGDVMLATFWARCVTPPSDPCANGLCHVHFVVQQNTNPYTVFASVPFEVTASWTEFTIPFKATESVAVGNVTLYLGLGFPTQTIDIGGLSVVNYHDGKTLGELSGTPTTYPGRAQDAAWRSAATQRIEQHRKADLTVTVQDSSARPVSGANVRVTMKQHAFGFGTAVNLWAMKNQLTIEAQVHYTQELLALFNTVMFENELEWPALAGDWGTDFGYDLVTWGLDWAASNGLGVRGHALVDPAWWYAPRSVKTGYDNLLASGGDAAAKAWLSAQVQGHVQDVVAKEQGRLMHWDVVDHPFYDHDLTDVLGPDASTSWFAAARSSDPTAKLFLSDYGILDGGACPNRHRDAFQKTIAYLTSQGAPLDGLGIQAYLGRDLTGPDDLYAILESLAASGREIWVTAYDVAGADSGLAAEYTRDLLTVLFSHPMVGGFMTTDFWDGTRSDGNAPFYAADWTPKPSGQAYKDLVRGKWWTDQQGTTDDAGQFRLRGFLGTHQVTVSVQGNQKTQSFTLGSAGGNVTVVLD
jgi:endo-1,4-beta-xylanase